jgi:hypothetical protein
LVPDIKGREYLGPKGEIIGGLRIFHEELHKFHSSLYVITIAKSKRMR